MGHHHHDHSTTADIWTKLAAMGEGTASFISDAYWLGEALDLALRLEEKSLGLSWYGMAFGTTLAMLTAIGSAYSHSMLNISHQSTHDDCPHTHACHDVEHGEESPEENLLDNADEQHAPLIETEKDITDKAALTWKQKAALVGDYISHIGDIAGPITFVAKIAAKEHLPWWGKISIQGGATLFGAVSSVAGVRSCANAIREVNEAKLRH